MIGKEKTADSSPVLKNYEAPNQYLFETSLITTPFAVSILFDMQEVNMIEAVLKFKGNFMKRIIYTVTIALSVLWIAACSRPGVQVTERERENYEKIIAGEIVECLFGLDANGSCLDEGDDGIW